MKVLITNCRLAKRTGTELYVYELALELLKRGHTPVVFSPDTGALADQLRADTVPVASRLSQLGEVPDIIHGHHFEPLLCASLRFPRTPAIFCCHSWNSAQDEPPRLGSIRRYVAVDATCRDRLVYEFGIPADRTAVFHNFVNLERFRPRPPLPTTPRRALLFTNRCARGSFLRALASACKERGLQLDLLGSAAGKSCDRPEDILVHYDIVFARAKAAIEAMAVGTAVVLCDRKGLGPMVSSQNFDRLRDLNFGRRSLTEAVTRENVLDQLSRYSAGDAAQVAAKIQTLSAMSLIVDQWIQLYSQTIADSQSRPHRIEENLQAASEHLERLGPLIAGGRRYQRLLNVMKSTRGAVSLPFRWLLPRRSAA